MNKFKVGDKVKFIGSLPGVGQNREKGFLGKTMTISEVRMDKIFKYTYLTNEGSPYFWREGELQPENTNTSKIVITSDGTTTLARLYDGKTVVKSAEAKCSPADTYDFAIGAKLAFDRLMPTPAVEPEKEVVEYRKTIRVTDPGRRYSTHEVWMIANAPEHMETWKKQYRPEIGEAAVVIKEAPHGSNGKTLYLCKNDAGDLFLISTDGVEPIAPPTTQDNPKEPIAQLYCVKDHPGVLRKGKVYTLDGNGSMHWDCAASENGVYGSVAEIFRIQPQIMGCLVPLVSRPAKVNEWVFPTDFDAVRPNARALKSNAIYKVRYSSWDGSGDIDVDTPDGKVGTLFSDEYKVLDGYHPYDDLSAYEWVDGFKGFDENLACRGFQYEIGKEYDLGEEEKVCSKGFHFCKTLDETHQFYSDNGRNRFCKVQGLVKKGTTYDGKYCARKIRVVEEVQKYYTGKVVCASWFGDSFTVGMVYEVINGKVRGNDGSIIFSQITDLNKLNKCGTWFEFKGEQP